MIDKADGRYCYCPVTHHVTLGQIVELFKSFAEQPRTLMIPDIPAGSFAKKLYSTYLSYLPYEKAAYPINAMGITKAIEEKIAVAKSRLSGDTKRVTIEEFNSDNTRRLNLEETKAKIASLEYIRNELNGIPNIVK